MMKHLRIPGLCLLTLLLFTLGCLTGEASHTIYLDPDGSVSWVVLQTNIHSDGKTRSTQRDEEEAFLQKVRTNADEAAEFLTEMGARSVTTRLLRPQRPFMILTEGRFQWFEDLLRRMLMDSDDGYSIRFSVDQSGGELLLSCLPAEPDTYAGEGCTDLHQIFEDGSLQLTGSRFTEASGFEIATEDVTQAGLSGTSSLPLNDAGRVVYSLIWESVPER